MSHRTTSHEEWLKEGKQLFGEDTIQWVFVCPSCGHVTKVEDWKEAGAPEEAVAFSCVGRWQGADGTNTFKKSGGPCNYAGGGLFGLNPVKVQAPNGKSHDVFEFAPAKGGDA